MAGRKAQTPMLNPIFSEKASAELSVLNSKLHDGLKQDLTRIYNDSLFPDLNLLFHSCCIQTHKGLLETRAPNFYREIFKRGAVGSKQAKQRRPFIDRLTVRLIESFIREVYTRNVVKHKEDAVVAQFKIVNSWKEVESPDSDVFVTPKASPCEPLPFGKQSSTPPPPPHGRRSDSNSTLDDIINRSQYYNLVHVEEDLSRELAEQDALSNSFRSILEKQELEEESRKPTILDFTSPPPEEEKKEYEVKSLTEERAKTLKILNKQYTYTVENEMSREAKEEELSIEAVSSSGYMTGGSPKDNVTEVASTEDIPHDDRSPSPLSSEQGTWDSTFPTNDENTLVEKQEEIPPTNNFFIDASSLRDEDESLEYIPPESNKIRRNTFELDPDDDKLAMLKEEYEKVNGFKKPDDPVPNITAIQAEEDHSPDSLNNDFPYESFDKVKLKVEPQLNLSDSNSSLSSKREADTDESSKDKVSNTQVSDLSDYSLTASPLLSRRRNEFAPILSGGCDIIPEVKKPKIRPANSLNTSWIVDMSDSGKSPEIKEKPRNNSTGFFVPLDDPFPSIDSVTSSGSESHKKNSSFYIDLKTDSDSESSLKKQTPQPEKKLFSIFIDIGDNSPKSKPNSPFPRRKAPNYIDRLSKTDKKSTSTSSDSGLDCENSEISKGRILFESLEQSDSSNNDSACSTKRQSFYMFVENESPIPKRKLPGMKNNPNRHSWNSEKNETEKQHKRSSSISYDGSLKLDKFESGPVSIDETLNRKIKASNELTRIIQNGARHEFKESKARKSLENHSDSESVCVEDVASVKSEFDISCSSHGTFIIDDVSKVVNVNSNDLELSTPSHDVVSDLSKDDTETDLRSSEELTPKQTEETNYVKLSDMDNQVPARMWKSQEVKSSRMTRSIPDGSWLGTKMMANSASSRSLSRLFPHLYPGKPYEASDTEVSNQSSMQSSINPSPLELSTEGTEGSCTSGGPCSRLGEDLLRMFLEEISPDVTVDVGGRRIKAHKCILSSRCQYFAAMLSGGWVESAGNVISLQGFSYNSVHFALCHIYSGTSNIPETINIVELATLADMLCLEGLKEVIMYTLKVKYCHFFHKPCNSNSCISGVLECLPLAAAYGLDEIYRKSLRWITKYFVRVWPTKGFANLPKELQDKCYKQHIVHLSADNVLDTIMGCEKLEANVTNVKWAQPVINMNLKLHEASIKYLTQHFASVISNDTFLKMGKEDVWTMTRLEETLLSISRTLSPDQSCQSYKKIKAIIANIDRDKELEIDWRMEFIELVTRLESSVEDCLVRQAGRAARTSSWAQMDLSLRKKIQEMACLVFAPGPRSSSVTKSMEGKSPRLSERSVPRPSSERGPRSLGSTPVLGRSKVPAPSSAKRPSTTVPKTLQPSNVQVKTQSPKVLQKSASSSNAQQPPSGVPRLKTAAKLSHVKSRYLEPKPTKKENAEPSNQFARPASKARRMSGGNKVISSSDSSRTSSPATSRVSRPPNKPKTPILNSRTAKTNGVDSKRESSDGSGGNPSPSTNAVKRTSTFLVATKSSAAKAAQPRNVNQNSINNNNRHVVHSTGRFHKDSPTLAKRTPKK